MIDGDAKEADREACVLSYAHHKLILGQECQQLLRQANQWSNNDIRETIWCPDLARNIVLR